MSNTAIRVSISLLSLVLLLVLATRPAAAQAGRYPASRHGGNYMFNFYFPPSPSSTPWVPAWAPDGRAVAVAMAGSIWRVDLASGAADELTYGPTYHSSPDWSPDGRWIVYTADHDGGAVQLEILNVASGATHALTDNDQIHADPVFSPDGTRVAYVATTPSGYFNVYIRPTADGRWNGDPIAVTRDNDFGRNRLYFGPWDMHLTPGLAAGRGRVAPGLEPEHRAPGRVTCCACRPGPAASTTRPRCFGNRRSTARSRTSRATVGVSSTHRRAGAADQFNNLYVQPTAGGEPYKITFFQHDAFHPRWSPDDEWIAFITNEGGLPQLALLETHGGSLRTVTIERPALEAADGHPVGHDP